MAGSAVPAVIDALVALASDALTTVQVYDGYGVTSEPGDYLMVGIDDPDGESGGFAADVRQEWAAVGPGAPRNEEGDITCCAVSWNGDGDQKAARDGAYAIADALAAAIRAEPSMGVPTLLSAGPGTTSQLMQDQGQTGAGALLVFRIHFRAYI